MGNILATFIKILMFTDFARAIPTAVDTPREKDTCKKVFVAALFKSQAGKEFIIEGWLHKS